MAVDDVGQGVADRLVITPGHPEAAGGPVRLQFLDGRRFLIGHGLHPDLDKEQARLPFDPLQLGQIGGQSRTYPKSGRHHLSRLEWPRRG